MFIFLLHFYTTTNQHFYPSDAQHSAVFVTATCPSVRPSVCHTPVLRLNG